MLLALCAAPAWAQLRIAPPSDALASGQPVNVFAHWEGHGTLDGFRLDLPEGWRAVSAQTVREGSMAATPLQLVERSASTYELLAAEPIRGQQLLVVGLVVGEGIGYRTLTLAPVQGGEADGTWRETWAAYVNEPVVPRRNRALQLPRGAAPIALRRAELPAIGTRDPYTLEFWIKTAALDEVVLSTWDGDEERPYPAEFLIDPRGHLAFYRGRPGRHESLVSADPVADGQWHHVAVSNDPFAGWTRLLVDGRDADSLRVDETAGTLNTMSVALGGRPGAERRAFSGLLDELRIWDIARSPVTVRRTMRVPLEDLPDGSVRMGFDAPLPPQLLVRVPDEVVRVPSDLTFAFPVENLEASTESGIVTLTWRTKDRSTEAFRVERSTDGQRFDPVGTVRAEDHISESADGSARYTHTDLPPAGQVLYYRIRQITDAAPERVSSALKLGLGVDETLGVAIVGNSPNPFRDRTVLTYDLARTQPVQLSVWDVSGTRVAVLLDETQPAGRHEFAFAATGLPSGIYFARLETPDGTAVHKMALTR